MKNNSTKEIILSKVFKLLVKKGYDNVSITDICKETEMARGLLYHYFGGKEELFVETTTKFFLEIFDIQAIQTQNYNIKQMIDYTVDRYNRILQDTFKNFSPKDGISIKEYDYLFYRVIQKSPLFGERYYKMRKEELTAWEQAIERSVACGELQAEINSQKCALYFIYLMDGVWMNMVDNNTIDFIKNNLRVTLTDYYLLLKKR